MIRVTSGTAKNKKLLTPDIPNFRAVQDITKQALFSIIGDKVLGADCLDLFAGSGSLGIEALSRGATWCDFVDENREAREAILQNLQNCNFEGNADIILSDAIKYVGNTLKEYNIIFLDPFYDDISHRFLMKNIEHLLKNEGVTAFTHGKNLDMEKLIDETDLKIDTERRFGASYLTLLSRAL